MTFACDYIALSRTLQDSLCLFSSDSLSAHSAVPGKQVAARYSIPITVRVIINENKNVLFIWLKLCSLLKVLSYLWCCIEKIPSGTFTFTIIVTQGYEVIFVLMSRASYYALPTSWQTPNKDIETNLTMGDQSLQRPSVIRNKLIQRCNLKL